MPRKLPPIPNPRRLEIAVTVEIYSVMAEDDSAFLKPARLSELLGTIQPVLISSLARKASVHGYYRTDSDGDFWITDAGLDLITDHSDTPNEDIDSYFKSGFEWVMGSDSNPAHVDNTVNVEDIWEPLPIDRGSDQYKSMIIATQSALAQIEGSNGYADADPEERNGVVFAIKGALQTVSDGRPSRRYIEISLSGPLNYIAQKFADGVIGQAAKTAVDAIIKWLSGL